MVYETLANGTRIWVNATDIFKNITNSTSPIGAVNQVVNHELPFFWPAFPFVLYLYLMVVYADSPQGGKL